jgi:hypothetical protein
MHIVHVWAELLIVGVLVVIYLGGSSDSEMEEDRMTGA